jgi:hypothetical protein
MVMLPRVKAIKEALQAFIDAKEAARMTHEHRLAPPPREGGGGARPIAGAPRELFHHGRLCETSGSPLQRWL